MPSGLMDLFLWLTLAHREGGQQVLYRYKMLERESYNMRDDYCSVNGEDYLLPHRMQVNVTSEATGTLL